MMKKSSPSLVCGEILDVHGRHARSCGGNVATLTHTHLKHALKSAVIAVAANQEWSRKRQKRRAWNGCQQLSSW